MNACRLLLWEGRFSLSFHGAVFGLMAIIPDEFGSRGKESVGGELANSQSFLKELCALWGVPKRLAEGYIHSKGGSDSM